MNSPFFLKRSLLHKNIVLPLLLLLFLIGAIITCGTSIDITNSYTRSVEERLQAYNDISYREIKKQERLLTTYATLLEYMQSATSSEATAGIIQDRFYGLLSDSNISVAIYSAAARESLPYPSLRALLDQAHQSGRPRFRFATELGATPSLIAAAPAGFVMAEKDVIVLQIPLDRNFLRGLATGFKITSHLLSMEGALLATGGDNPSLPPLERSELAAVLTGKLLFKTADHRRYLFQAIPLGTTDLVIAVAEAPMNEFGGTLQPLILRTIAIFLLVLLVVYFLYSRLVRQITSPLDEIMRATRVVGEGNLSFRLHPLTDNKIGQIGTAFNTMLERIEAAHASHLARQRESSLAQAEARHQELLERKNLEIAATHQEMKIHQGELSLLFRLIQATNSIQDINLFLERVVELIRKTIPCQNLALLLHHPGSEELEVRKVAGSDPEQLIGIKFRVDNGFTGRSVKLQEMVYLNDLKADNARFDYQGGSFPGGSLVCAPMVMNRRLIGVILLQKESSHAFSDLELKLIQAISWQTAIGLETARLYEWTYNLSTTDDLTGLSNRRFFQEILKRELAQAQRYGSQFSLLMLDLDHFKTYNEAQGDLCGDMALKQMANILLQNTRGIDLVARFGTDRFVILLPKTDKMGAFKAAEKLRLCIAENEFPGAMSLPEGKLTVSIGISGYPMDSREAYEIIDRADRALRLAKEAGRNRCQFWQLPQEFDDEYESRNPAIS